MKIGRLKRRAEALAADARADRLEYKTHADRMLVIARRGAGSTAGLAISFSLGFMAGTGTATAQEDQIQGRRKHAGRGRRAERERSISWQLAHGPVGEVAMKLGMAFLARSLMKLQETGFGDDSPAPPATHTAEI